MYDQTGKRNGTKNPEIFLYKDKRFRVTTADVGTHTSYYPLTDSVGRVRYDILFAAIFYVALVGFALFIYFDLWYDHEILIMAGSMLVALLIGFNVSILQLDARGFPARFYVARARTVRKIFNAITDARAYATNTGGGFEPEDMETTE